MGLQVAYYGIFTHCSLHGHIAMYKHLRTIQCYYFLKILDFLCEK